MSRIIKSMAVVEGASPNRPPPHHSLLDISGSTAVLKSDTLTGRTRGATVPLPMDKTGWQDELNRVKLEINESKAQLRTLQRKLDEEGKLLSESLRKRKILEDLQGLDVDERVKGMIEDAQNAAEAILEKARQDSQGVADQMRTQGYLDGLEQGASEAREQFQLEQEENIHKLSHLMEYLSNLQVEMERQSESDLIKLTLAVAEKIIGRILYEEPEAIADMLRHTLEENRREAFIKIVISADLLPAEARVSEEVKEAILALGPQIDVFIDGEAPRRSIVVETPKGYTDLTVSGQLENIHQAMLEES